MQRLITALIVITLLVGVGVLGALYTFRSPSTAPSPATDNSINSLPTSGGTSGYTQPGQTQTQPGQPQTQPSQAQAKSAVLAAYEQILGKNNSDHIKPGITVVANGFALQVYKGNTTAGEALFKYDSTTDKWKFLDGGGGDWSVAGLMRFGMSKKTALILLSGVH